MSEEIDDIKRIDTLKSIRKRPGMYVGDTTDGSGLHHLLYWALDDILDNARAGRGKFVKVKIKPDNTCIVSDEGDVLPPPDSRGGGITDRLERLTTEMHGSQAQRGTASKVSLRDYLPVMRALSETFTIVARVGGETYCRTYERGNPITPWEQIEAPASLLNPTVVVQFKPDPEIFSHTEFDVERVRTRMQHMAATYPGLLTDLQHGDDIYEHIRMPDGMADMVKVLMKEAKEEITAEPKGPFRLRVHQGDLAFDVAIQWHWGHELKAPSTVMAWANTVQTRDGGSHVLGLNDAIKLTGLNEVPYVAMVSVFVPQPRFVTPTKGQLQNPEIRVLIRDHLTPALRRLAQDDEFALELEWMCTRRAEIAAEKE